VEAEATCRVAVPGEVVVYADGDLVSEDVLLEMELEVPGCGWVLLEVEDEGCEDND